MNLRVNELSDPALRPYAELTEAGLRNGTPGGGTFIAESLQVISIALEQGYEPLSFLCETNREAAVRAVAEKYGAGATVYTGERAVLEKLTGYRLTRGVLCHMKRKPPLRPEEVLRNACRVAVMEDVTDSTNVGAVFRSAAALGMDAVLLAGKCCDPLCRRAVRVSMGTVFQIPWAAEEDGYLALLAREGFETLALALDERARDVRDDTLYRFKKTALLLGTEGTGLRKETVAGAGYTVKIPMKNGADSLNVAAAAAVAFWEMNRRADAPETGRKEQTDG